MNTFEKKKLLSHISNEEIINLFKKTKCFIAGGAITSIFSGKDINDVDVYFRDYESLVVVLKNLFNHDDVEDENFFDLSSFSLIYTNLTKKSILFTKDSLNIQLIYFRFFDTPTDVFNTFDFTINMGLYDCANEEFVLHEDFLKDIAQRKLAVNPKTAFPIISLLRIDKYKQRGYKVSRKDFINLCLAVNKLDIKSWDDAADAIGGMYGYTYTDLFDTKQPFSIEESINQLSKLEINLEDYKNDISVSTGDFYDVLDRINFNLKRESKPDEKIFYKKVAKTDTAGVFRSYYYQNFQYPVGSIIDSGAMGIWVYKSKRKANNHFVSKDKNKETIISVRALDGSSIIKDSAYSFRIVGKVEVIEEIVA